MNELEQDGITYLKIEFGEMFNMRNIVTTSLYDFIDNFSKDGISKVPDENVLALTQQMNSVCKRLYEAKALTRKTTV